MSKNKAVYTHGPIGRTMLKNGLAMLAGTIAICGYNIVDTYFVGQLGTIPLAAMGFTFPVIMLLGCIFHGIANGVMAPTAQLLGNNKHSNAARVVTSGFLITMVFSIALASVGILCNDYVFIKLGAAGETLEQVKGYMNIWYIGCFTASLGGLANSLLVGAGSPKVSGFMMMTGMLINAVLDPIFIFGWCGIAPMGIKGAALATVISQFISAAVNICFVYFKHRLITFEIIPWRVMKTAAWQITRYAIPNSISMMMMPIGSALVVKMTSFFGDAAVAASAAAGRLEVVAFLFPMALGITLMPTVGQNFGAKLYSRIRECHRFAMGFAFIFLLLMGLLFYILAPWAATKFSPEPEVQKIMIQALRIIPWGLWGVEIHRFSGFFYTGCDRPVVTAYLNIYRIFVLMVPLAYLGCKTGCVEGIFAGRFAADVIAGATGFIISRIMVRRLPKDGAPKPVPKKSKNKYLSYIWEDIF
ncbi:MAG: MATE family efflux transporter [Lentisphaeria bacterium]|nr:MATE family efflux transporter [Lentisphaeria bacterium]